MSPRIYTAWLCTGLRVLSGMTKSHNAVDSKERDCQRSAIPFCCCLLDPGSAFLFTAAVFFRQHHLERTLMQ